MDRPIGNRIESNESGGFDFEHHGFRYFSFVWFIDGRHFALSGVLRGRDPGILDSLCLPPPPPKKKKNQ